MLPSKLKVGVIGAGQLGKMLAEAGSPWNIEFHFLDVNEAPAQRLAYSYVQGGLKEAKAIRELASRCDVLTYEIESIDVNTLLELEKEDKEIIPSPKVLSIINDKGLQNNFLKFHNIPIPAFYLAKDISENITVLKSFKGENVVIKSCKGGYDGKGVEIVSKEKAISGYNPFGTDNTLYEECITDMQEVSIIVAVDKKGNYVTYPSVAMEFDPKINLVSFIYSPGGFESALENKMKEIATKAVKAFQSPGLFAVELFVHASGKVLVNEIAPRAHNSGHHTIEGAYTSQYEQWNRILLGMPLGNTDFICPAAMINLIGPENGSGAYELLGLENILQIEGVYVHLYGKKESRPGRKLGHITILADTKEALFKKAEKVRKEAVIRVL
jgi:5-(carboxyamino)imidazole ribonucleotide synthase